MKLILMTLTAATAATMALAEGEMAADTNGDGAISLAEFQAAMPEMTAQQFAAIDTDGDGMASEAEVMAAMDAGLLSK